MIILFGGGGFIGRHICAAAEGRADVTLVARRNDDRFLARHAPSARFMNLEDFAGAAGDRLIAEATATVYLANTSVPGSNLATPWRELSDNVAPALYTFNRLAALNPAQRVILTSSGGTVYGHGTGQPASEETPTAPISPYGLAKVMVEDALKFTARLTGIDPVILRISNPIGRWNGARGQGIAPIAVKRALAGEAVTIYGDGLQVRDYFDADDLADLVLRICERPDRLDSCWNVGSGLGCTVMEIVELVGELTGRPVRRDYLAARPSDVRYVVLDTGKIERELGWTALTPLKTSIAKLVDAFQADQTSRTD